MFCMTCLLFAFGPGVIELEEAEYQAVSWFGASSAICRTEDKVELTVIRHSTVSLMRSETGQL